MISALEKLHQCPERACEPAVPHAFRPSEELNDHPNSSSTSSLPAVLTGTRNLCSDAQGGSPPSRGQMETLIVDFYEADPKEL